MQSKPKPKRKGRPPLDGTAKKAHSIHLTAEHIKLAKRLGDGNLSAGVRKALEEWKR